jgi:hypothetical protein
MRSSTRGWLAATAATAVLAGCASKDVPPPRAEFARAELAIEQAVTAGATEHAPLALREARQKLERARTALYDEEYAAARRLADEAQVNAQLSMAEAQTARAEQLAQENMRSVEILRQELQQKEGSQ